MFTEREAIKQRMNDIKEERRALADEYSRLLERLRTLDAEVQGVDFMPEYANMVEQLSKAVQSVTALIPTVPAAQVIEKIKEETNAVEQVITREDEPKTELQENIEKAVRKARVTIEASESQLELIKPKKAEPIVLNILREEGIPLAPTKIYELLNEKGFQMKTTIHEILRRLSIQDKIESPSHGFWQAKR